MNEAAILAARANRRKILMRIAKRPLIGSSWGRSAVIVCLLNGTRRYLHIMKQVTPL